MLLDDDAGHGIRQCDMTGIVGDPFVIPVFACTPETWANMLPEHRDEYHCVAKTLPRKNGCITIPMVASQSYSFVAADSEKIDLPNIDP